MTAFNAVPQIAIDYADNVETSAELDACPPEPRCVYMRVQELQEY